MSDWASRISGTGSAFPRRVLSNDGIVKRLAETGLESTDQWIQDRTGIRERRLADPNDPNERNSSLAFQATLKALEMAGKTPEDIDQIIFATCTPDTFVPGASCWLQNKLGATRAHGFDLNAACSGFVFGLNIADLAIRGGSAKTVLVVGSEILSSLINWSDRGSCILFGDGAGAAIVERVSSASPHRILEFDLHMDGTQLDLLQVSAGGSAIPLTPALIATHQDKIFMRGREMFKTATRTMAECAQECLKKAGVGIESVSWFVPHQANLRIIEAVASRLEFPMEKVVINIDRYGNTSAATIPTALDELVRSGKLKSNDLILLATFGAGTTSGASLLRWA